MNEIRLIINIFSKKIINEIKKIDKFYNIKFLLYNQIFKVWKIILYANTQK